MKKSHILLIVLFLVVLFVLFNSFYIIDETQQVIITQFGKPIGGSIKNAGLHVKVPFLQKVHYFDKRILEWDGDAKQIPTSDKRYIWLDTFSRWQIADPLKFYETTRYESNAHGRLDDIISGITRDVISSNKLLEIVRSSNREMVFTAEYTDSKLENITSEMIEYGRQRIADSILTLSKVKVAEYGINLIDVRIKRLNYNQEVQTKVFERMISERNKIAAKYLSEGKGNSSEILGKMQRELDQIQSTAYQKAQEVKGRADAKAIKIYADAYNRDPEFYEFLKTLETYEKTIDSTNTMIMTTDGDYYKFLKSME